MPNACPIVPTILAFKIAVDNPQKIAIAKKSKNKISLIIINPFVKFLNYFKKKVLFALIISHII